MFQQVLNKIKKHIKLYILLFLHEIKILKYKLLKTRYFNILQIAINFYNYRVYFTKNIKKTNIARLFLA